MLEFIIHPGPGKTGSSSIQMALLKNSRLLLDQGILVPQEFRSESGDYHALAEFIKLSNANNAEAYISLNKNIAAIAAEANRTNSEKVIVSSDYLANLTNQDASLLNKILLANGFKAKIILYRRNLYKLAVSTFQQQIQNGKHLSNFHLHAPFTYFHMMKVYCDAFGSENVFLRDYLFDHDRSWSTVSDFFSFCLSIDVPEDKAEWVNRSQRTGTLNLLNYLNYFFAYPTPPGSLRIAEVLRWSVLNIPTINNKKLSISKQEADSLREYFLQDEILFESFLPERSPYNAPFFSEIPEDILGESFNENVCTAPSRESIESLFSTLGSYVSHPHLIAEIR